MNTGRKGGGGSDTPDGSPCKPQAGEPGFRLAGVVAKRGGLEGTAVAGELEPMAKPSAWFSQ